MVRRAGGEEAEKEWAIPLEKDAIFADRPVKFSRRQGWKRDKTVIRERKDGVT